MSGNPRGEGRWSAGKTDHTIKPEGGGYTTEYYSESGWGAAPRGESSDKKRGWLIPVVVVGGALLAGKAALDYAETHPGDVNAAVDAWNDVGWLPDVPHYTPDGGRSNDVGRHAPETRVTPPSTPANGPSEAAPTTPLEAGGVEVLVDPMVRTQVTILNVPQSIRMVYVPIIARGTDIRLAPNGEAHQALDEAIAEVRAQLIRAAGDNASARREAEQMDLGGAVWGAEMTKDGQIVVDIPENFMALSDGSQRVENVAVVGFAVNPQGTTLRTWVQVVGVTTPKDTEVNFGEQPQSGEVPPSSNLSGG